MQAETINGFRLSPQQGRLWTLQQDSSAYRTECALLLEGKLDKEILKQAFQTVVSRHEILRTTFHRLPGMKIPVQVVSDNGAPSWEEIDLSDRSTLAHEAKVEEGIQAAGRRPFDFERGPLLHVSLLKLSENTHVLVVALPALCADAWSVKNLVQEITQAYDACSNELALSDETLQYVQFSEWQNELLEEEDAETGKAYWRNQNVSEFPSLRLPFEANPAGKTSFEIESLALTVDPGLVAEIDEAAQKHQASIDTFLLACWQTLLWRLTGQSDVIVGDACDGRPHEMLHNALGLFAKWLPVRCHFERSFKFSEILSHIAETRRNAYEWQEYFVWDSNSGLSEDASEQAFFPVGFEYEQRTSEYKANGVSFSLQKVRSRIERFNIHLSCIRAGGSLTAEFHYNPHRFRPEDIRRLASQFDTLLRSVTGNVDRPVADLEILSDTEKQQLLVEFNQTDTDYPREKCIHQMFEEQVERTPDHLAVAFGDEQLSYAALNTKANQLAHHLKKLGIGPDVIVGLCVERAPEMLVGILGILKAGGAYLPMEPMYPKERLAFMLADTGAPVLLTQKRLVQHLPEHDAQVVCIDAESQIFAQESDENLDVEITAEHLAYVIYTSGSTGKPKGVMIHHRSAVNLASGLQKAVYADHDSPLRVSLNAPLTFDASVKQVLQLLHGHTLSILPEEVRPDGKELLSYLSGHALDVLDCTPAQLRLLLAAGLAEQKDLAPKLTLVGGEALDETIWASLANDGKTCFYNVYGPTECTVDATVCCLRAVPAEPTIGRPIANTRIYLLDDQLAPVPLGVAGELHIGGHGLARGYVNDPELTAEKFIPNPFGDQPGARLYKTGDMGSYFPDGNIKFLGRKDFQVKIRGFRIELEEIEAVLAHHPAVQETAVIVREDVPGDMRLVAYVVPHQKGEADINELRSFLREKLPEYMVPSAFVLLNELPLTRNGKVDRQALPAPDIERPELKANYVAPRTKIEGTIAKVWQEVLQVKKVGVDDNFFDLGGHSLLMVQVHSKLREAFSKDISLIEMFRNPTVSALAKYFSEDTREQPSLQRAHDRAQKRRKARSRQTKVVTEKEINE